MDRKAELLQAAEAYKAAFRAWDKADRTDSNDVFYKFRGMRSAADTLLALARDEAAVPAALNAGQGADK